MTPHSTHCSASLAFDMSILVSVGRDGVSVSNKPFSNVLAVASHGTQNAAVLVVSLDGDSNIPTADGLNQCTLDALSVLEPVAVLVLRPLIPFGRVHTGNTYVVSGYSYSVAVGHISPAGDRLFGPFLGLEQAFEEEADYYRDTFEKEENCYHDSNKNDDEFGGGPVLSGRADSDGDAACRGHGNR